MLVRPGTRCDVQTHEPVFTQPRAGANADYAFGSAFAVDIIGGVAQLFSLGDSAAVFEMMMQLPQIKAEVERLAAKIGATGYVLPTYGSSEDFARPHIEVDPRGYHYVVVEHGQELRRVTTSDLDELLSHIFDSVTFELACSYELAHRIEGQDCRRLLWRHQPDLLQILSPAWAAAREREIRELTRIHPYNDHQVA
jgi:Immunity protein 63